VRALDPRLFRYARATRTFLYISVALGSLGAALIVAQAWLIARAVAGAFVHGEGLAQLRTPLIVLLCVVMARALIVWVAELAASRSSARAKSELRAMLLARIPELTADSARVRRTGELAILATRGIDALDDYFALYLPQLVLAAIVPVVVVAVVAADDWISAAIVAVTIPLIPLFMALVGATTRERMDRQLQTLERLAGHFLDVVAGLPTLKVFGRARVQAQRIAEITDRYREAALATLQVTFLSSLILELVATIAVALVAVAIGLRLMGGHLGLRTALFALILAPEAYLPLRRLGANYHASAEGLAAAERAFAIIEAPSPSPSPPPSPATPRDAAAEIPDLACADLVIDGLSVIYPDRAEPALTDVSLTVAAGETVALVGPSGCGKSTLLGVLLGLVRPDAGSVRVGGMALADLDSDGWLEWRARLAWVPQRPYLFAASLADNVRLGRRDASAAQVHDAIAAAGLAGVVAGLPAGADTVLGEGGAGLSAGERQRLALARAFLRDARLLLLDEPTAGLDGDTEREIVSSIQRLAQGRTVLLVAHRPALVTMADRVVSLVPVEVVAA
jgi:ATP-binding cassette, subfamily C, bacterial CydCD